MERAGWTLVVPVAVLAVVVVGGADVASWHRPGPFALVHGAAALAALIVSTAAVAMADRTDTAEQGLLGSAVMAAAVMAGVQAVITPGVILDSTEAFRLSSLLTPLLAAILAVPLLLRRTALGRRTVRAWRPWTLAGLTLVFAVGAVVVAAPGVVTVPGRASPVLIVTGAAGSGAFVALATWRRRLDGRLGSADGVVTVSLIAIAAGAFAPVAVFGSVGSWVAHSMTAVGLLGAAVGLAAASTANLPVRSAFAPVLEREPLLALELDDSAAASKVAEQFDRADPEVRAATLAAAELALRIGDRCGMTASELRVLGLAALLHDAGRPEPVRRLVALRRRLTDVELALVHAHPVDGEAVLAAEPFLAAAAPLVRSHHERVDGRGYPDGLVGDDIPLGSRIIAVCEALTALTGERPYRRTLPLAVAVAVLREHAGAQWDERVVEHALVLLPTIWPEHLWVESDDPSDEPPGAAVPDDIADLLAPVGIEI